MVLGKLDSYMDKNEIRTLPNTTHKDKLKFYIFDLHYITFRIKDLNVRPETIKLLKEKIGRTLDDINQSKILYDPPPRITEIKTKVNKWDLIKLKLLHSKGNYKQGEKTSLRMGKNNSK